MLLGARVNDCEQAAARHTAQREADAVPAPDSAVVAVVDSRPPSCTAHWPVARPPIPDAFAARPSARASPPPWCAVDLGLFEGLARSISSRKHGKRPSRAWSWWPSRAWFAAPSSAARAACAACAAVGVSVPALLTPTAHCGHADRATWRRATGASRPPALRKVAGGTDTDVQEGGVLYQLAKWMEFSLSGGERTT